MDELVRLVGLVRFIGSIQFVKWIYNWAALLQVMPSWPAWLCWGQEEVPLKECCVPIFQVNTFAFRVWSGRSKIQLNWLGLTFTPEVMISWIGAQGVPLYHEIRYFGIFHQWLPFPKNTSVPRFSTRLCSCFPDSAITIKGYLLWLYWGFHKGSE